MMETTTTATTGARQNLPLNFGLAQEGSDGTTGNQNVSHSPSQSLLAQLSNSPYGWGSRSASPTPPLFSSSLRRTPSNRFMSHGHTSLQSLVKSFINKVSRGTQTDCDDNFDQISIASLTSGFSAIESDLTRSRLKLFLNDPISTKNTAGDSEFVEELQKLRDQIDDRFKYGFSSQPGSQPRTPKDYDDGMISLELDRNLADFGHVSATCDRAIETDRFCFKDEETQVDLISTEKGGSSIIENFFPFFQSESQSVSFNVASQTELNIDELCSDCKKLIGENKNEMKRTDSIRFIPGTKQPILKCEFLISPSDLKERKSQPNIFTFDEINDSMKSDASTQINKGAPDETQLSNNDNNDNNEEKPMCEEKTKAFVASVPNGPANGGSKKDNLVNIDKTPPKLANGVLKNKKKRSKNMKIVPGQDDDDDVVRSKQMSRVRPKCCTIA